jgi:hypothetical protein
VAPLWTIRSGLSGQFLQNGLRQHIIDILSRLLSISPFQQKTVIKISYADVITVAIEWRGGLIIFSFVCLMV